jgi:cytidylate kinase
MLFTWGRVIFPAANEHLLLVPIAGSGEEGFLCYNFYAGARFGYGLFTETNVAAITISRQLGSLGDEVAAAIGDRLSYRVVCRELINQAARLAGDPVVALATIDDLGLLGLKPSLRARNAYHRAMLSVMESLAQEGKVVIVGRAGQVLLSHRPDVVHVKVMAPFELRVERISEQLNVSKAAARARVEASDRTRKDYLKRYFKVRWDDPELYDIIINTARLEPQQAACLICQMSQQCLKGNLLNAQSNLSRTTGRQGNSAGK